MLRLFLVFTFAVPTLGALAGCDTGKIAVSSTAKIAARAKPGLRQEADYELAARAMPGTLKTIEGFHAAYPGTTALKLSLAEAYCQYGTGFIEDEWEVAKYEEKDLDKADYIGTRSSKMFIRCLNYALEYLGDGWAKRLEGPIDDWKRALRKVGSDKRDGLMWVAAGLASLINRNIDNLKSVSYLEHAEAALHRLLIMDGDARMIVHWRLSPDVRKQKLDDPAYKAAYAKIAAQVQTELGDATGKAPADLMKRGLPHMALGMLYSARSPAMGGLPERGKSHFERAITMIDDQRKCAQTVEMDDGAIKREPVTCFLLAKVIYAIKYGVVTQNREFFHESLVQVLQTNPAAWPENRLANEIAHRRARRYLKMEKEWF